MAPLIAWQTNPLAPHVCYLLHFDDGTHYVGTSKDLSKRVEAHEKGKGALHVHFKKQHGVGFTVARTWEGFPSHVEAREKEKALKHRGGGRKKVCPLCTTEVQGVCANPLLEHLEVRKKYIANPISHHPDGYYVDLPRRFFGKKEWWIGPFHSAPEALATRGLLEGGSASIELLNDLYYVRVTRGLALFGTPHIGPFRSQSSAAVLAGRVSDRPLRIPLQMRARIFSPSQKQKMSSTMAPAPSLIKPVQKTASSKAEQEAVAALQGLGYKQREAMTAVRAISQEGEDTETLIRKVFRQTNPPIGSMGLEITPWDTGRENGLTSYLYYVDRVRPDRTVSESWKLWLTRYKDHPEVGKLDLSYVSPTPLARLREKFTMSELREAIRYLKSQHKWLKYIEGHRVTEGHTDVMQWVTVPAQQKKRNPISRLTQYVLVTLPSPFVYFKPATSEEKGAIRELLQVGYVQPFITGYYKLTSFGQRAWESVRR